MVVTVYIDEFSTVMHTDISLVEMGIVLKSLKSAGRENFGLIVDLIEDTFFKIIKNLRQVGSSVAKRNAT